MYIWLFLALFSAVLEAIAVSKNIRQLEYIAKPAVMLCLFVWLSTRTGLQGETFWFGLGILFSLAGDLFLMFPSDRMFLFGLMAFLFAHIVYIAGFHGAWAAANAWSWVMIALIALNATYFLRRFVAAIYRQGKNSLVVPILVYGIFISVMLYAALSTLQDPAWKRNAAWLASAGALLFVASDMVLAWNKFVLPAKNRRVWNIVLYHLGQIGLIAGVISQFG